MGTIIPLDDLYQCIAAHIKDFFEPDVFNILKFDQEQDFAQLEFEWKINRNKKTGELFPARFDFIDQNIQRQVNQSGEPFYIPDFWYYLRENDLEIPMSNHRGGKSSLNKISDQLNCSMLLVPLDVEDQLIGVLQILKGKTEAYCQEDLEVLKRIANVVAIGLQKAYLYKESEKLVEKLTTLQRIEQVILENLSLPTTLDILVDQLVNELRVDAVEYCISTPN